jgi:hypothetical protein
MSCELINVEIQEHGNTTVTVQPFSLSAVKHASTHYLDGNDPVNHNNLSGLQGGLNNQYYHLDQKAFQQISSGVASFTLDIPSGVTETGILFPFTFSSPPAVYSNIISPYSTIYLTRIEDPIAVTGFNIYFSSKINNTGYRLQTLAYINT